MRMLRMMGWRYSANRGAWVHRAFRGRVGPVFVDPEYYSHPGVTDTILFEASPARKPTVSVPEHERTPLPQRPAAVAPAPRPAKRVKVRLDETDEPRVVVVDGTPPRRGVDPASLRTADAVVVPIKSARATG